MKKFNEQNTEGFTREQLGRLNLAYGALLRRFPELDEPTICDALTNSWVVENDSHLLPVGNDFYSLTDRAARKLGRSLI